MKRTLSTLAVVALAVVSSACLQHTYTIGTGAPEAEIVYKHWHHHWLFGLIRPELQKQLEIDTFCPSGNATIHEEMSFANGIVDLLAFFIYTPTTVTVRCADGDEVEVALEREDIERIALDPLFLEYLEEVAPERTAEARAALDRRLVDADDDELVPAPR